LLQTGHVTTLRSATVIAILSLCLSSATLVHPTQQGGLFRHIFALHSSQTIRLLWRKYSQLFSRWLLCTI